MGARNWVPGSAELHDEEYRLRDARRWSHDVEPLRRAVQTETGSVLLPQSAAVFVVLRGCPLWGESCDLCGGLLDQARVRLRALHPTVAVHEACHAIEFLEEYLRWHNSGKK